MIMTEYNRFEFEQEIMQAWGTKEDLELFLKTFDGSLDDRQQNYIIGLIEVHEARMQSVWDSFEASCKIGIGEKK